MNTVYDADRHIINAVYDAAGIHYEHRLDYDAGGTRL